MESPTATPRHLFFEPALKPNATKDCPTDIFNDAQKKLLFEPAEPELFRWKNLPKWKDSMRTLLPQEFQRWDPLENHMVSVDVNPFIFGPIYGIFSAQVHNYVTCTKWWKVPWRTPAWMIVWTFTSAYLDRFRREMEYENRKSRLLVNNYFNRVRQVIVERERKKHGPEHTFKDVDWANVS